MLKRVLLFIVSIMIIGTASFADEYIEYQYEIDFVNISNKEIMIQADKKVIVSFDITNTNSNSYTEIFCRPVLKVKGTKNSENLYLPYYEYDAKEISLDAYETKNLTFELKMPKLPDRDKKIVIEIYSKYFSGAIGTVTFNLDKISVDFEGFLQDVGEQYWELENGEKISSEIEKEVKNNESLKIYLNLTSLFENSKKVIPKYEIYKNDKIYNEKPVYIGSGDPITFAPGEEKEIELRVPNLVNPEKYQIKLRFVDAYGEQVSNLYEYRYYILGESAKITKISFDRESSKLKAYMYATKELNNTEIEIKLYDINDELIDSLIQNINLGPQNMVFEVALENIDVEEIKLGVNLRYNGKELDKKIEKIYVGQAEEIEKFTDIVGRDCEKAVRILNGVGILNGYPDNTYKPENLVTRAEFSTIVTKLKELNITEDNLSKFSDISGHWAESYISELNKEGFVSGYPNGTFGPQNNVTYSEAITILLNSLGYKNEVNSSSVAWPDNYIRKALELKISKGINIENYSWSANRGDIAQLTLNAYLIR